MRDVIVLVLSFAAGVLVVPTHTWIRDRRREHAFHQHCDQRRQEFNATAIKALADFNQYIHDLREQQ